MMRIVGLVFDEPETTPTFTCPVCGKKCKGEKSITNHMKKEHPGYTGEDLDADKDPE